MKRAFTLWLCVCLAACADDVGDTAGDTSGDSSADAGSQAPTVRDLVDHTLWVAVDQGEDPFWPVDGEPPEVCAPDAYEIEDAGDGLWFSLETSQCNYLTVRQSLLADVPEGASIQVRIWHFQIVGIDQTGSYWHRIAVGDPPQTLWEVEKEVPTESGGLLPYEPVIATVSAQAGEPVYWHVSNHGQNSWHLIELSATY